MKRKTMPHILVFAVFWVIAFTSLTEAARIKDLASIEGVRENQLIGYGLVIGLNGTGDRATNAEFAIQTLKNMLTRMGLTITVEPRQIRVKNVAAVMVTAKLPPFARKGSRIDILVSSVGDAISLQGGTLLLTPLKAPDQQIYAVAQGPLSIGGFLGGGAGATVQKNHATVGTIAGGAIVEKEVEVDLNKREAITIALHKQDFTTALRLAEAINAKIGSDVAFPLDSGTVRMRVAEPFRDKVVEQVASIEALEVAVDLPAKVILNERTGTIVIGENVRISPVAISHGNLTIKVQVQLQVSQPGAFSGGETAVVPKVETEVEEQEARVIQLAPGVSLGEVVRGLNAVGATPRDLVAILQALKAAGALQADLEIL
jgi:flagellar P-ring protein precursor FlgI